jgi:hypothetical protein
VRLGAEHEGENDCVEDLSGEFLGLVEDLSAAWETSGF